MITTYVSTYFSQHYKLYGIMSGATNYMKMLTIYEVLFLFSIKNDQGMR